MKLVKQECLEYREGTSDKVYEVDLCEVSAGRYVVNFRYGRRGSALKEGAKTARPVGLASAESVFAELTSAKLKKGYVRAGDPAKEPAADAARAPARASDAEARARAVLERLAAGPTASRWPIERAAWRAGELGLREAAPALVKLLGAGAWMRSYAAAWALGRCGDASAVEPLSRLYADARAPGHVRRIAREALLQLSTDALRAEFRDDTIASLPEPLRAAVRSGDAAVVASALDEHLAAPDRERVEILETLYLVDGPAVRPALLAVIARAPFEPPWFRPIRRVFKAAEYRRDAEVFGRIAYRFETSKSRFRSDSGRNWVYGRRPDGAYYSLRAKEALVKDDPEVAYGAETRTYFRRRVWRMLRRLGETGSPDFVRMAVGVLLPYSDADAAPPKRTSLRLWRNRRYVSVDHEYGPYAAYLSFNGLLYSNGSRFELSRTGFAWWRRAGAPADEPEAREEAFPELWDAQPVGLLHLLAESACEEIHRFAVKALGHSPDVLERLDDAAIAMLVGRPYDVTARFGFELAARRYDPTTTSVALMVAVAASRLDDARAAAHRWIEAAAGRVLADEGTVAELATAPYGDTRRLAIALLERRPPDDGFGRRLAGRALAALRSCTEADGALARDLGDLLAGPLAPLLAGLDVELLAPLVTHPVAEVRDVAVRIFPLVGAPPDILLSRFVPMLLESDDEAIRANAVALVAGMSDEALLATPDAVAALVFHRRDDVRAAVRPLVVRLVTAWTTEDSALRREGLAPATPPDLQERKAAFGVALGARLVAALVEPEPFEGLHESLAHVLRENLPGGVHAVSDERMWRLIREGSPAAQSVGGWVLGAFPERAAGLETAAVVDLASHEIATIRAAAHQIYLRIMSRFSPAYGPGSFAELATLVRALDCPWDDTRPFWHELFRLMQPDQFTPAILIAVCDSPRDDTRALGRELVRRNARPEDGLEYLAHLAEHPSGDMQLFVTNYLDTYARGDAARLAQLAPYFTTVLSRVNAGRAAKERILALLADEAAESEEAARVAAAVLSRLSATTAVGDRATAIEALVAIQRRYPEIDAPLSISPVEVRHAV